MRDIKSKLWFDRGKLPGQRRRSRDLPGDGSEIGEGIAAAPHHRVTLSRKPVTQSVYHGPVVRTYKDDARSYVWLMESRPDDAVQHVAKRFVHNPVRQRVALWSGLHPAQLELRGNRALQAAGVPVAPIVDGGIEPVNFGYHAWLITPRLGSTLQHMLADVARSETERLKLVLAAALLTRQLLDAGFTFRDLKPSNIVINAVTGSALLLDVGSVQATTASKRIAQMLGVMDRVMVRDGVETALRRRYTEAVRGEHGA